MASDEGEIAVREADRGASLLGVRQWEKMVRPERIELPTSWFVAKHSIQLSYGRVVAKLRLNYSGNRIASPNHRASVTLFSSSTTEAPRPSCAHKRSIAPCARWHER